MVRPLLDKEHVMSSCNGWNGLFSHWILVQQWKRKGFQHSEYEALLINDLGQSLKGNYVCWWRVAWEEKTEGISDSQCSWGRVIGL